MQCVTIELHCDLAVILAPAVVDEGSYRAGENPVLVQVTASSPERLLPGLTDGGCKDTKPLIPNSGYNAPTRLIKIASVSWTVSKLED